MTFPFLLALAGILSLASAPRPYQDHQAVLVCRYRTDMQPIVKSVSQFIRDAPGMDASKANMRFTRIARTLARVESRDGRPAGAERIHALLFTAMGDVEAAVNLWRKYHDPEIANGRVYHARRTLSDATARLQRVPCRVG